MESKSSTSTCLPPPPLPPGIQRDRALEVREVLIRFKGGSSSSGVLNSSRSESSNPLITLGGGLLARTLACVERKGPIATGVCCDALGREEPDGAQAPFLLAHAC